MNNKKLECLDCKCILEGESERCKNSFLECPQCHKVYEHKIDEEMKNTKLYNFDKFRCPKCNDFLIDNMFEYGLCPSCGSIHTDIKSLK